jgi:hypothetical protein
MIFDFFDHSNIMELGAHSSPVTTVMVLDLLVLVIGWVLKLVVTLPPTSLHNLGLFQ